MFYSETLLSKTGPLARVWLSANLERKLSKTHILQSNIEQSVGAIVDQGQAPMALRLSGQLLLGVVRIYSRKTRYLLEDCNEALMKIKMAFRPGNVDLPAGSTTQSAAALVLPDAITELDLALPDPNLLLSDLDVAPKSTAHVSRRADITLAEDTLLQDSIEHGRDAPQEEGFEFGDDILQWQDLDLDIGEPTTAKQRHQRDDSEVEVGRDVEKSLVDDMFGESGLGPNAGFDDTITKMDGIDRDKTPTRARSEEMELQDDLGLNFDFDQTDNTAALGGDDTAELPAPVQDETMLDAPPLEEGLEQPEEEGDQDKEGDREGTPATVNRASAEPREEGDNTYMEQTIRSSMEREEEGIVSPEKPKPVRKRKAVHVVVDETIEIRSKQIKAQQADHTAILKEPDFLPRDPTLLTLMSLQNTGKFAASIYFPKNMHPDLVELLSPDFVKSMAAAKRKRDAEPKPITLAGDEEEEPAAKKIQLEIPEDEEIPQQHDDILRSSADRDLEADKSAEMLELPEHREASPLQHVEDISFQQDDTGGDASFAPQSPRSREYTPIPISSQTLSQQTVHAVHRLREEFDPTGENPKDSINFESLCPPKTTTRVEATKMFFEILVLATKDAVTPKQEFGGFNKIEVSPKQALWDARAEERDEVQVAEEEEIRRQREREKNAPAGSTTPSGVHATRTVVVSA